MTERSEFADKLFKALQENGHAYTGKISITDTEYDAYRDLSPRQMAEKYAKSHSLNEKGKVLSFLKEVYRRNVKGEYGLNAKEKLEELDLEVKAYLFYFRYGKGLIMVEGERRMTEYKWLPETMPIFSEAEKVYNEVETMRKTKLTYKETEIVFANLDKTWEEIVKLIPLRKEISAIGMMYKVKESYGRKVSREGQLKNEKSKPVIFSTVVKREIPETIAPVAGVNEETKKSTEIGLRCDCNAESTLFLLNEKLELQFKIIKNQEIYIKKLENQIIECSK